MPNLGGWSKVDALLDAALDQPAEERSSWLREACGGDDSLHAQVEELLKLALREDDPIQPGGAMVGSLWDELAVDLQTDRDRLEVGARIGAYEILGKLGSGGMGSVYRAKHPNLNREVAVKSLSQTFTSDSSGLRRFEREAKLLASLKAIFISLGKKI